MRFHVLGLPHTVTNHDYVACAYTQKVFKFCKMMKKLGHYIIHYGHADSDPDADDTSPDSYTISLTLSDTNNLDI